MWGCNLHCMVLSLRWCPNAACRAAGQVSLYLHGDVGHEYQPSGSGYTCVALRDFGLAQHQENTTLAVQTSSIEVPAVTTATIKCGVYLHIHHRHQWIAAKEMLRCGYHLM